jgi:hypothetical protein
MSLKEQLSSDLTQALRANDDTGKRTIRLLLSVIHNAEIEKSGALEESEVLGIIAKQVKQRRESAEEFRRGNRLDLVEREEAEAVVLQKYLPAALSREEIEAEARQAVAEVGAQGPRDMGKVMGLLTPKLRGRADGSEVSAIVRALLAEQG